MAQQSKGLAVVIGASGGIGGAIADALEARCGFARTLRLSRSGEPAIDLTDEASILAASQIASEVGDLRFLMISSGFLHDRNFMPEKSFRQVSPDQMAQAFAVNATGPALVLKHFLPLVPREGRSVIAAISARVGSIGDNDLGGWISYRASKAALNQIMRTAAVELRRTRPEAVCMAIHPGTVDTALSSPFAKTGLNVRPPAQAAAEILNVLETVTPTDSGSFRDYRGAILPW